LLLASCAAPIANTTQPPARAASVAEFLAAIRTRGAAVGCNRALVETMLGARMEAPKVVREYGMYKAEYEMRAVEPSLVVARNEYVQFHSPTTSLCQITMNIPAGTLCNIQSDQYRAIVGEGPVPYTPPHPRGRTPDSDAFHLFGDGPPAQRDEVWLSTRYGEQCVHRVIIRTRGTFEEVW
jgi:hypothetical protein